MKTNAFTQLLENENDHLNKLHQIVLDSIEEEKLLVDKVYSAKENFSLGDKVADIVAEFGGSWKFIILFLFIILGWIVLNIYWLKNRSFDPYPFILLNLVLSCIAALQAPIIMMSQNRKEDRDRKRAENDYLVNLKSEIEIRNLHQKLDLLIMEQMKSLFETQKIQMETIEKIEKKLNLSN